MIRVRTSALSTVSIAYTSGALTLGMPVAAFTTPITSGLAQAKQVPPRSRTPQTRTYSGSRLWRRPGALPRNASHIRPETTQKPLFSLTKRRRPPVPGRR
ncbi:hypothetical protein GCM10020254_69790 [Streptomyces goshikiensis]